MDISRMQFLCFKVVSERDTLELLKMSDAAEVKENLLRVFELQENSKRDKVFVDFHYANHNFAVQNSYSPEKYSTFLAIMNLTLINSLKLRYNNDKAFEIFQQLLLKHSIQRSPKSIAVFTLDEVRDIVDFALLTMFRHYTLYDYAYNPHEDMVLSTFNRFEGVMPQVLPLATGKAVDPLQVELLQGYVEHPPVEDKKEDHDDDKSSSDELEDYDDPVQGLLNYELKKLRKEMTENMKKQDADFLKAIGAS